MSILPIEADYTDRDFDALKARLQRGIRSVFPKWTDFNTANFGNIIVECLCFVGDVLAVYEDNDAREAFLSTCVLRINAIRHARRIGYTMRGASAAGVDLQFTLRQVYADVTFAEDSIVRTKSATDPARVRLLSDLLILGGNLTGTVSAENSLVHTESFESNGDIDQEFVLTFVPFLRIPTGGLRDATGTYEIVEHWLDSGPADRHAIVLVSEQNRGLVKFGDGINGKVPSGTIDVDPYLTGGGAIIIDPDTLQLPEFTQVDALSAQVLFDVTNPEASVGGEDQEGIEEARMEAPATLRTNERSVAKEDFEINARRVAAIARALMLTSDQWASLDENYGQLYCVGAGAALATGYFPPAAPSQAQLDEVKDLIDNELYPTVTFRFDVLASPFLTVNITARLWLTTGANPATVDAAIRADYGDFFAVLTPDSVPTTTVDFGYNYRDEVGAADPLIAWSDLFGVVIDTPGVRKADEDAFVPFDDVPITLNYFPRLGTVTLINARTGLPLV